MIVTSVIILAGLTVTLWIFRWFDLRDERERREWEEVKQRSHVTVRNSYGTVFDWKTDI